jgi:hypothetical protein
MGLLPSAKGGLNMGENGDESSLGYIARTATLSRFYLRMQRAGSTLFMKPQALHEKIVCDLKTMIEIFASAYPASSQQMDKTYRSIPATYIKAWLGVVYMLTSRSLRSRKYLFETFKNKELIDCLDPKDICILGGRFDRQACSTHGYGYFWTGGVMAAIIVALRDGRTTPLRLQIAFAQRKLKSRNTYIFLYTDVLPISNFFALLGDSCSLPTICVAHGWWVPLKSEILIDDGEHCRFNLLYSMQQKPFNQSSRSTFFELGPPFDAECGEEISNEVVLVGTGAKGMMPEFYFRSLEVYSSILEQLGGCGWNVRYRPHPNEDPSGYSTHFTDVDKRPKSICLSGSRKLFVGYESTLLYEAKTFGHSVVRLLDSTITEPSFAPNAISFAPNAILKTDSVATTIEATIDRLHREMHNAPIIKIPPVRDRFLSILAQIQKLEDS